MSSRAGGVVMSIGDEQGQAAEGESRDPYGER